MFQNVDSDKFLVYGQEYQNMRNKLTKIYMERNPRDVQDLAEVGGYLTILYMKLLFYFRKL